MPVTLQTDRTHWVQQTLLRGFMVVGQKNVFCQVPTGFCLHDAPQKFPLQPVSLQGLLSCGSNMHAMLALPAG